MPTKKPRMMLTLEPQTYATFKRFSAVSRRPMATVVSELLEASVPEFEKLGVMLQQAREIESRTQEQQAAFLTKIGVMAHRSQAAKDFIYSDLVTTVQSAPATAAAAGVGAARPRSRSAKAAKNGAKKGALSLIHTNKPSNPMAKRVPAGSASKKRGANRETS